MQVELQHKILEELKAELAAHPVRRSRLADYDGLIADMREAGAPWRTIRRYLAKTGLEISAEAIRAYWHRHHKSRSRSTISSASNPKPQTKPWTFNPPSTLE